MKNQYFVGSTDGVELFVTDYGNKDRPGVLFLHGASQSHLCWQHQTQSFLTNEFNVVTMDLRGHGNSAKPATASSYNNSKLWADDIAAVLDKTQLKKPVLVGWSYAGIVIFDYVRHYSAQNIAGINFVGANTRLSTENPSPDFGPLLNEIAEDWISTDIALNIEATKKLVRASSVTPLQQDIVETAIASNMLVSPQIRTWISLRDENYDVDMQNLNIQVLISQGKLDQIVLPAAAEHINKQIINSQLSYYNSCAHAPFLQEPERFNHELATFVRALHA